MFDAIVIGLGGMGSATLHELACRGLSVLGLEQFHVAHNLGSSHGETRIIRRAYFEHPHYVPLVDRAFQAWLRLERNTHTTLLHQAGLLLAGPRQGEIISGTIRAAETHHLDIHELTHGDCAARFPGLRPAPDTTVLFEPDAGFLEVEKCILTYVDAARQRGASVRTHAKVTRWERRSDGFAVRFNGDLVRSKKLAICGGPWSSLLLADLKIPLTVLRKPVVWFETTDPRHRYQPRNLSAVEEPSCPVFGFDTSEGFFYGFPSLDGRTLKVANHSGGDIVRFAGTWPDRSTTTKDFDLDMSDLQLDRDLHDADVEPLRRFVRAHLPGVSGSVSRHSVCMYTMTPDQHFVIDLHPHCRNLAFAAGFSGHGFKFAPVIGGVLADLLLEGKTSQPVHFLRLNRPGLHA